MNKRLSLNKKKPRFKNQTILVVFSSPLSSGCDYAIHTLKWLSSKNRVYGFSIGEPITWRQLFSSLSKRPQIIDSSAAYTLIRPLFFIPGRRFRLIQELNLYLNSLWVKRFIAQKQPQSVGQPSLIWYFEPFHLPVILKVFHDFYSIYDCVDYFPAFSEYSRRCHQQVLKLSQAVFANSQVLAQKLRPQRPDVIQVPLGFAEKMFKTTLKKTTLRADRSTPMVAGFVGGISSRIDFKLLLEVARKLPQVHFLLVGPLEPHVFEQHDNLSHQLHQLLQLKNVQHQPGVPKSEIPSLLTTFDIGLIPYQINNRFNRYCFPMKSMEYFYVGLPIVTTQITELKRYQEVVYLAHNASEMVKHIRKLVTNPHPATKIKWQKKEAVNNSWEQKLLTITNHLLKILPRHQLGSPRS